MKILVVNGPNLNILGKRDPAKYGNFTLSQINSKLKKIGQDRNIVLEFFQSNYEGKIIDFLQKKSSRKAKGLLINPGALVRYGYSLRQALIDLNLPVIEVHMSRIDKTGISRKINVLEDIRIDQVSGLKEKSYTKALDKLIKFLKEKKST